MFAQEPGISSGKVERKWTLLAFTFVLHVHQATIRIKRSFLASQAAYFKEHNRRLLSVFMDKFTYRFSQEGSLSVAFNSSASLVSPTSGASRAVMIAAQLQILVFSFHHSNIIEKHRRLFPPYTVLKFSRSPGVIPSWRPTSHHLLGCLTATLFIRSPSSGSLSMDLTLLTSVWVTSGIVWIMKGHHMDAGSTDKISAPRESQKMWMFTWTAERQLL